MADPTPQEWEARIQAVEAAQAAQVKLNDVQDKRIKVLEDDDSKVHGAISWVTDTVINNPKAAVVVTMILTAIGGWIATRLNVVPGVQSDKAPVVAPAEKTAPATVDKLEQIRKNLKEIK